MPGLVPASTSSWRLQKAKPWMAGTSPAMTLLTHCFGTTTSNLRLDIEPHDPVFQSSFHRRIKFQNFGIVTRYNVVTRRGELLQRLVALKRVADAVGNRKHAAFIDMRVKVRAAAHRTVDLQDIFLCQRRSDFCRNTRSRGRQIDETLDALAVDDASLAGRDFLGNLQRRQAGHYGLDPRRHSHDAFSCLQRINAARIAIVSREQFGPCRTVYD